MCRTFKKPKRQQKRGKKFTKSKSYQKKSSLQHSLTTSAYPSSKQFSHLIYRQYGSCTTGNADLSNAIVAQDEMGRPFIIVRDQGKKEETWD